MTSTLGVWILTGYGAAKAPRLMQFSVHCDHLRSVLFVRAGPSPYGEMLAVLTTLLQRKRCAPQYTATREDETFMDCQLFSPYGETQTVLSGCFPLYGEKHAVLIRCFPKTFSASSTIRRNACPFVNVFPRKILLP